MANPRPLDFTDDPHISPRSVMRILEDFLPFAVDAFTRRRELFDQSAYEPGLCETNFAVILAEIATGDSYREKTHSRSELIQLIQEALARTARCPWREVQPLAWSYVAYALVHVGDRLERSLYDDLRTKVANWADVLLDYDFPTGLYRDTKAEETCWTVGPLVGAQALWPGDPRCAAWQEKANGFYLNSYNREEDLWEEAVVEGLPVRDRVSTANVFLDFTTENHGAFHPAYQACINNYAIPYIIYKKSLGRVPDTLVWNWKGLHSVMSRLYAADGRILYPTGNDYYPYSHCEQAHYLAIVTDALRDPLGLWALKKALRNVHELQQAHGGRVVDTYLNGDHHIYWEFHFTSFVAFAHALAPYEGIEVLDDRQALDDAGGPWVSPYAGILVHKGRKLHAGFGLKGLVGRKLGTGFVVPQGTRVWTDYFCSVPQLAPTIRDASGEEAALDLKAHAIGSNTDEAWALGAWADRDLRLRRTMAYLAHEEGVLHVEHALFVGKVGHGSAEPEVPIRPRPECPGLIGVRPDRVRLEVQGGLLSRGIADGGRELRHRTEIVRPDTCALRNHEPCAQLPAHKPFQAEPGVELPSLVDEDACVGGDPGSARIIQCLPVIEDLYPLIRRQGVGKGHERGEVELPVDVVVSVQIRVDHPTAVGLLQFVNVPQGLLQRPEAKGIPQRIGDDREVVGLLAMGVWVVVIPGRIEDPAIGGVQPGHNTVEALPVPDEGVGDAAQRLLIDDIGYCVVVDAGLVGRMEGPVILRREVQEDVRRGDAVTHRQSLDDRLFPQVLLSIV